MMLGRAPGIAANLATDGAELHVIGKAQATSDLPEDRHLKGKPFDGDLDVDQRTRGLGGLLASCGEENLLRLPGDRYAGRDICVHEFAHTILAFGLPDEVRRRITEQFRRSSERGLWKSAYAASNDDEFFAELSMWYFGSAVTSVRLLRSRSRVAAGLSSTTRRRFDSWMTSIPVGSRSPSTFHPGTASPAGAIAEIALGEDSDQPDAGQQDSGRGAGLLA